MIPRQDEFTTFLLPKMVSLVHVFLVMSRFWKTVYQIMFGGWIVYRIREYLTIVLMSLLLLMFWIVLPVAKTLYVCLAKLCLHKNICQVMFKV